MAITAAQLSYVRGDTGLKSFTIKQDGSAIDLTGVTGILITVTAEKTGTTPLATPTIVAQLVGSLSVTPTDGKIFFQPIGADETARQAASEAFTVGDHHYSVRWIDANSSEITPIADGAFKLLEAKTVG